MVHSYTPAYYSSVHETITSLCKNILPFSFKNRRLISQSEKKLAKRQSDNLKWQQESFHRILNLIGLQKEGIASNEEVSSFRSSLLKTLITSPEDQEAPGVIRDKLLFLQDLLYAKCISSDEYHSSKRPLLRRLAAQGAEIDCRNVIACGQDADPEEEWSEIELRDQEITEERGKQEIKMNNLPSIKDAMSFVGISTGKGKENRCLKNSPIKEVKVKKKSFSSMFHKEQKEGDGKRKLQLGLEGIKKWKRSSREDEYLAPGERPDEASSGMIRDGPDTKRIKTKIHSDGDPSDFFIDKVLGENIKKELSRIKSELHATNPNLTFSDDQIEAISTRLPVDKADLKRFFPKSWCDRYGEVVLDVVKKEFKDHVGEMETLKNAAKEKRKSSERWVDFDEKDQSFATNLFFRDQTSLNEAPKNCFVNNHPIYDDDDDDRHHGDSSWARR